MSTYYESEDGVRDYDEDEEEPEYFEGEYGYSYKDFNDYWYENRFYENRRTNEFSLVEGLVRAKVLLVITSILYVISCILFMVYVSNEVFYLRGYYRPDLLPGPYTDWRYGADWIFFVLHNTRILLPVSAVWALVYQKVSFNTKLVIYLNRLLILFDFVCIWYLFVVWCFFCNNGGNGYRNHLCTAPLDEFCRGFWDDNLDICLPSADPPLGKTATSPRFEFILWLVFVLVYYFVDRLIFLWLLINFKGLVKEKAANDVWTGGKALVL